MMRIQDGLSQHKGHKGRKGQFVMGLTFVSMVSFALKRRAGS